MYGASCGGKKEKGFGGFMAYCESVHDFRVGGCAKQQGFRSLSFICVLFHSTPSGHLGCAYTVEPPNKGHFWANSFVPCREVDPVSEVK